jgi:hypothetical protein
MTILNKQQKTVLLTYEILAVFIFGAVGQIRQQRQNKTTTKYRPYAVLRTYSYSPEP